MLSLAQDESSLAGVISPLASAVIGAAAALWGVWLTQHHQLKLERARRLDESAEVLAALRGYFYRFERFHLQEEDNPSTDTLEFVRGIPEVVQKLFMLRITHPSKEFRDALGKLGESVESLRQAVYDYAVLSKEERNALALEEAMERFNERFDDAVSVLRHIS